MNAKVGILRLYLHGKDNCFWYDLDLALPNIIDITDHYLA